MGRYSRGAFARRRAGGVGVIYLSGAVRADVLTEPGLGVMLTPDMGNRPDLSATAWAADNGCFSQGATFSIGRWLMWLERMQPYQATCLFAVAPDVLGDAVATWKRSRLLLPLLRDMGWPAALVAQDGMEHTHIHWRAFDALFIGGSTRWKLSPQAAQLVAEAKQRGKWVHMGRVNSARRLRIAAEMGCDSADGTFLAYGPDRNIKRVRRWLSDLETRPSLWRISA